MHSDRRATVFVAGATTGVTNVLFTTGCTIADLVAAEEDDARNHGQFVSGLNHLTKALMDAGVITKQERDRLHGAAAHATAP